jgi:UDP-glucose 4-epimerase
MQNILSPNEAEVWSIKPERDFLYTRDASEAIVSLLDTDYTGPLNLGAGTMSSVGRVVEIAEDLSGKKVKVLDIPVSGPMKFRYDISLVEKLTGWQPRHSLEEGLTKTYNEMKAYADECRWWEQKED